MRDPDELLGYLCALIIILLLGSLIGAIILRTACSLYNKLAGAGSARMPEEDLYDEDEDDEDFAFRGRRLDVRLDVGVPEPSMGKAMGIILLTLVIQVAVQFVIAFAVGGGDLEAGLEKDEGAIVTLLVELPLSILIVGGLCTALLPTSFGKGMLVSLLYLLITIVIAFIILAIAFGIALALGLRKR